MIKVKLFGGAKKSFGTEMISFQLKDITIHELLTALEEKKPDNTLEFDVNNVLIAVNGIDSSAIKGKDTVIHSGDIISIIPVIHGGSSDFFTILKTTVTVCPIHGHKDLDHRFLNSVRLQYPKLTIQAISSKFILNQSHIKKILTISLISKKRGILLSDKLETDILLRFAATTQISKAISDLGIKPKTDFVIIALGHKLILEKLRKELCDKMNIKIMSKSNESHIKKYFNISKKRLDSVSTKTPLEDILQEQSSILF